jgi:N-acetylmuramoyl-L-alanine amidase
MTTMEHDPQPLARSVFAGLAPSTPLPATPSTSASDRDRRASKALFGTGVVLVGAMTVMNLTGQVEPVHAEKPHAKPKGISAFGKTLRDAVAATVRTTVATPSAPVAAADDAPATYRVVAGDTVSAIAGRYGLSTASVLALNGLGWSSLIFPGQELKLTSSGPVRSVPQDDPVSAGRYTIVAGDTISAIAARFGVSTQSVLTANGLGWSSIIYPGQTIAIPGLIGPDGAVDIPAPEAPVEAPVEQPAAEEVVVEAPVEAPVAEPEPAPAPPAPPSGTYTIVSGDTVSSIAARFGLTTDALLAANGLDWSSVIYTGHTLVIPGGGATAPAGLSATGLSEEAAGYASIIIQVGRDLGVSDYGIVIALATAMQESTMRNLDWGDRDSVGLFQQRPSSGWGSVAQLTDPWHSARLFYGGPSNPNAGYTRGLLDIPGWWSMPLTQAAQAVQISAFPDAYAKWESSAWTWLAELG